MRRKYFIIGVLTALVIMGLLLWRSTVFHLVKTDPRNNSRPNQYTSVSFYFNQTIQASGSGRNQITITPAVSGKILVGAKSVTFTPDSSFNAGTAYTATLNTVASSKGKKLSHIAIHFTPQYVAYSRLPKDVQQRLVDQTDTNDKNKVPYSASIIAIQGSGELVSHGVTSQQLSSLQQAYFNFFQFRHIQIRGLALSNIVKTPHDPNSASTVDSISFTTTLDNKSVYKARVDYSNLTTIRLYLYDNQGGQLIYDSGNIGN